MNNTTEPQLPNVLLTSMKKEQYLILLWFALPFIILAVLDGISQFIDCMRNFSK